MEYFISTNGARKGLADTALKTADAGYLTRRLVDIAQDVVINQYDCGTLNGVLATATKDGDRVIVPLRDKVVGRIAAEDVINPNTDEIICQRNNQINEEMAEKIDAVGIDELRIRSVLTCETRQGVCSKCYGRNLASGKLVNIGEAVGIIAAQSIGQPGTQLTMRTFHIGGAAEAAKQDKDVKVGYKAYVSSVPMKTVINDEGNKVLLRRGAVAVRKINHIYSMENVEKLDVANEGKIISGEQVGTLKEGDDTIIRAEDNGIVKIVDDHLYILSEEVPYQVKVGSKILVNAADIIEKDSVLAEFDPFFDPILAEIDGKVEFEDLESGITMREVKEESTGVTQYTVMSAKGAKKTPGLIVYSSEGRSEEYLLPNGAVLNVTNGASVKAGFVLAKIPRKASKTRDITGGLPRVAELFEARVPKEACTLAEVEGTIEFGGVVRDKRVIFINGEDGSQKKYTIPQDKRLLVQPDDYVFAGDALDDGPLDPHSILAIKGVDELQVYLVREVQDVYRVQGVTINDKHIEVIIRQMLRKVQITDPGDTIFVVEQQIDRFLFEDENKRVEEQGGEPATATPILLGLIKASLNTESFISAASFQETTRVLTDSAIKAKIDQLVGLKENVIIGHLIPAGTGLKGYRGINVYQDEPGDLENLVTEEETEAQKKQKEELNRPDLAVDPSEDFGEEKDKEQPADKETKEETKEETEEEKEISS